VHPGDVLTLIVEICIAIAGFSGIVVILGRRPAGEWSAVDRLRLHGLLNASFAPTAMSGLALILLASEVPAHEVWRISSAVYALLFVVFWTKGMRTAMRLDPQETSRVQIISVGISGASVVLILTANAIYLHAFWAFAIGLTYHVALALFNFVGVLTRAISDEETA
jgi:hypothetical protein